ncbi:MAG: lysine--tRNA ligase [Patescibacteria group bacterium]
MALRRLEEIRKIRLEKVKKLLELGINPYPSKVKSPPRKISSARKEFDKKVEVAGRIWGWRGHGNSVFADIKDESGKIQLFFQKKNLKEKFKILQLFDIGDFIWVSGKVFKTEAGEVTLDIDDFQLLTKSIRPLPSTWHGLTDVEERYRKRYLDLLLNEETRRRFDVRTKIVTQMRKYLDDLGYWEVETPTLQPLYGGANAKPFTTHHNALNSDYYLRIADELYLKRLIVGGYEKVYEIAKDFRNEGIDQTHNPEFTMIEFYEAYADYHKIMDVTEGLYKHLAKEVLGSMKVGVGNKKVDIGKKWPRVEMVKAIKDNLDLDVEEESVESLRKFLKKNNVELAGEETKGQLIYLVFEHLVTKKLVDPVWIIDYPKDVSPLSKAHKEKEGWVERFEGYVGGREICDGWSELTDPMEQRKRFESDVKAARKDKEEAQQVDEDFIEAMEYGSPPLGGIGIGIDRLAMFFTNTWSIKEVILFPTLKPESK